MEELKSFQLADEEQVALRRAGAHRADYAILGRHVRLAGNAASIIEHYDILYAPFRRESPGGRPPDIEVLFGLNDRGEFTAAVGGEAFRVTYPDILRWPSVILNRLILARIRTHYLIHAGCVARNGKALLISGASGMGKTTLVAQLAARGFAFLSDEFAPIDRRDRFVDPYPMRLGLRAGPGRELLGDRDAIDLAFRKDAKKLADIESLAGRKPGARAALHAVVILTTDLTPHVTTAQKRGDRLKAWFTRWPEGLASDLARELGAEVLDQRPDDDLIEVTLRLGNLLPAVESMRDLARRHGSLLAQIRFEDLGEKDRSAEPRLLPISPSAGVMEMVKKMPSYARSAMVDREFGGKTSAMVMDLSTLVKHATFCKLSPGRLDASIDLVEKLMP